MPRAIDQEVLEGPNMKVLDINNPPTKPIPYQAFPKAVYLHPKDKTKEHRTRVVADQDELTAAQQQGWKTTPHVPEDAVEDLSAEFEAEAPKRGPGRPKADVAA